mmetsp:Transcript_1388/g.8569  ORF Transcript_1388/g.8569 Transcript_1388/m.8569 type:complete len:259 (-) Transcript_1388:119-895(-)
MQQSQQVGLWIQIQCLVKESKGNFFLFYALSAVCFLLQHQDSMAALPQFLRSRAGAPDCAWILQFHGTYPREVAGDSLHGVADVVEDQAFFSHLESLPAVRAPKVEGFVQKRHRSFVLTFQDPCRGFFHVRTFHCLPLFFFTHEAQEHAYEFLPSSPCAFQGRCDGLCLGFPIFRRRTQQQRCDGCGCAPFLAMQRIVQELHQRRHVLRPTLRHAWQVHVSRRRGSLPFHPPPFQAVQTVSFVSSPACASHVRLGPPT